MLQYIYVSVNCWGYNTVTFLREMKGLKLDPPSTKPGAQFLVNQIFTQDDFKVIKVISTA